MKSNLIMLTQCQKVNFRFSCIERSNYMNMFLWLLDFVTPLNNFFRCFSILVYNNTIISLRLIVYDLIIANEGLRPSFAIYETIYDSPLRDNCKYPNFYFIRNVFLFQQFANTTCVNRNILTVLEKLGKLRSV